ncbi:hypothetical protein D3C72_1300730 [compost metagenome]
MGGGVVERGDHAQRGVAHGRQHMVVGQVARGNHADAGGGQPALPEALHERHALFAGGQEQEYGFGPGVLDALDERRELGVAQRHADRLENLPAAAQEVGLERGFGVDAGRVVRHQRDHLADVVAHRPGRHRRRDLRQRHRDPRDVVRLGGNDGGGRVEDHHRLFRLLGDGGHGQRLGREAEAGQDVHLVAYHQFLGQALGHVRHRAGGVLEDDFDLAAAHGVAVELLPGLHAAFHLLAVVGKAARERGDQPDLDRIGGKAGSGECQDGEGAARQDGAPQRGEGHRSLPKVRY